MIRFILLFILLNIHLVSSLWAASCAEGFNGTPQIADSLECEWQGGAGARVDIKSLGVADSYKFSGLATYLNAVTFVLSEGNDVENIQPGELVALPNKNRITVRGRFNVAVFSTEDVVVKVSDEAIFFQPFEKRTPNIRYTVFSKDARAIFEAGKYQHLWGWLALLAKSAEWSLVSIQQVFDLSWGLTVIVFSIAVKVLLIPVSVLVVNFQRAVSKYQSLLEPQIKEIKSKHDGEQAHERIMAAHKSLGISPFYTLKPMLGTAIQIPILIAVFNALGEMPHFNGSDFLWINNLAYPDAFFEFQKDLPLLGGTFNLLPILMTIVSILSALMFKNKYASPQEVGHQRLKLYLMAIVFLVLFYPFPAVMVLYWTLANILHAIQQQFIKI
ncbi:membrane protein insertase YidC [Oceanicoccus sp. KOV_DT_Chl]|uniref:YidC/Oxa1 family membrane protein insertase n=1 Tax=Oceanicoccus sp. KOV_DT_Chl TaxID=1904639 RepID=UPI000C7D3780|nr:membrane protein insertase YidC [Oceanicoccus sp. KOV_DT_Chl]